MTTFSPCADGSVATRRSIVLAVELHADAAVLRDALLGDVEVGEDLDARGDGGDRVRGHRRGLLEHAVDAVADAQLLLVGLEVDVGAAAVDGLLDDPLDHLDDRGVLAGGAERDRRLLAEVVERAGGLLGRALRLDDAGVVLELGEVHAGAVEEVGVREALEDVVDVARRGDGRADLVAGHHGDVVDGQDVGGIGHRDLERAVALERDRDGLVAADRGRGDELGGIRVDAEDAQVEVVEAEALGDGAGELVLAEGAGGEQHALDGRAGGGRLLGRLVHLGALHEPEVHDHVAEHAARAPAP